MLKITFALLMSAFVFATGPSTTSTSNEKPDNTTVNKRDSSVTEVTADQQPMNKPDTEVTRLIRKELMKDDSLSTYAHNVKIVTENGQVTLKGPVKSDAEKQKVVAAATRIAGSKTVINELEVTP